MSAPFRPPHQHETGDAVGVIATAPSAVPGSPVDLAAYDAFVAAKRVHTVETGFAPTLPISPILFPFQRDIVAWALRLGRAALFESFGLGKSLQQLEIGRQVCAHTGGRFLIVTPLGVRQEFARDAALLGVEVTFIRRTSEAGPTGIYLTNYESVRDTLPDGSRKVDPRCFDGASLDEASCLRGFGGTKTFREFMALFAGDDRRDMSERKVGDEVRYRFVATATPAPNEYIELLAYAAFLGVCDVSQAKTRFFKRNSEKADHLTIHPHKEREFWEWVASWAVVVTKPSDVDPSYSDEGYTLPELDVRWHEVPTDHADAGVERDGQVRMFRDTAMGVTSAAKEKRESLPQRMQKLLAIRAEAPLAHRLLWHDQERERKAIEEAVPTSRSVYGSQDLDEREKRIIDFAEGRIAELAGKPEMLGSGCNFQRHCAWAVYLGIGFKFNNWIQSVHRLQRFGQTKPVRIDLIYTEAEREVRAALETKWSQHRELVQKMTAIVREYGLGRSAGAGTVRTLGCERVEESGGEGATAWTAVNADTVHETARMDENSVGLLVTSIPFSTQYEYSPSFNDFGHTDTNSHFWQQMDYLTPSLLKVLQPGRVFACHVKDRIVPGGLTGLGFQTVYPFHCDAIAHYTRHGFAFLGMITIITDVVRENNGTYRLAYTEQCKDGSRQGRGLPEYLLLFRKPQTDRTTGYADTKVTKRKRLDATELEKAGGIDPLASLGEEYRLARWQVDAAGFARSSGDRPLTAHDFEGVSHGEMFKLWRKYHLGAVYDYEQHVELVTALEDRGALPVDFALMPAHSWSEWAWSDIARMRTLNGEQARKNAEQHLCPLNYDTVDRAVRCFSQPGEVVYDPFMGLGTVPLRAVMLGRRGRGTELNPSYFRDAVAYLRAAEQRRAMPSLFDLIEVKKAGASEGSDSGAEDTA